MQKTIMLGPSVFISDPCYSDGTWCQMKVNNVLPGEWLVDVLLDETTDRPAKIILCHTKYKKEVKRKYHLGDIGVDSGQAGVFDALSYRNDEAVNIIPQTEWTADPDIPGDGWYTKMCTLTLGSDKNWGTYDKGVVSQSGYGDGMYPVYCTQDKNKNITRLEIDFLMDDED